MYKQKIAASSLLYKRQSGVSASETKRLKQSKNVVTLMCDSTWLSESFVLAKEKAAAIALKTECSFDLSVASVKGLFSSVPEREEESHSHSF